MSVMSEEQKEAIESVKSMFGDITIEKLIKDKNFNITIYSLGILDVLRVIAIVDNLQKELEEKATIIMAGAEKVKQLEKEIQRLEKDNDTLSELVIVNEDKVIKELDLISKDKIREKIKNIEDIYKKEMKPYQTEYGLNLSLLSKKEKEEVINKRNGLLTQKITLEKLLEGNENE